MSTIRCLLFDLDGTLLDTAPDMTRALNRLRREQGLAALPAAVVRPWVSHGTVGLLKVGFGLIPDDPPFEDLRRRYLAIYQADLAAATRLFPGMDGVLRRLEARGLPWGVVTNKPGWLTEPLLETLGLYRRAACVVSGDTTPNRKPHPGPLLHACRLAGVAAAHCLYVGDAERDIQAGAGAGMATVVARYGYIADHETPEAWGADAVVDHPTGLLAWLPADAPAGAVP